MNVLEEDQLVGELPVERARSARRHEHQVTAVDQKHRGCRLAYRQDDIEHLRLLRWIDSVCSVGTTVATGPGARYSARHIPRVRDSRPYQRAGGALLMVMRPSSTLT